MTPIILYTPVWGETFCSLAQRVAWASLLAVENLPSIAKSREVEIVVCTTAEDLDRLDSSPCVQVLRQYATVRFEPMKQSAADCRYQDFTNWQIQWMTYAQEKQALFAYVLADQLFANGSMSFMVETLQSRRGFLSSAGRIVLEDFDEIVKEFRDGHALAIPSRELSKIILHHSHEEILGYHVGVDFVPSLPINLIWVEPSGESALWRSHTLGLLGINFQRVGREAALEYFRLLQGMTVDHATTMRPIVQNLDECYIARDSDDYLCTSPTGRERFAKGRPSNPIPGGETELIQTIANYHQQPWADHYARYFVTVPYRLHTSDDTAWVDCKADETLDLVTRVGIVHYELNLVRHSKLAQVEALQSGSVKKVSRILSLSLLKLVLRIMLLIVLAGPRLLLESRPGRSITLWQQERQSRLYQVLSQRWLRLVSLQSRLR